MEKKVHKKSKNHVCRTISICSQFIPKHAKWERVPAEFVIKLLVYCYIMKCVCEHGEEI